MNTIIPVTRIYVTQSAVKVKKRQLDCAHGDILVYYLE